MAELNAVPFSALPQADDGYTVLYENDQVCRSEKKLSELVGDKTSSFLTKEQGDSLYQEKGNYLVPDDITGKLDKSQYAADSATFLTAHQDISNKLDTTAFSTVSGNFLTAHQSLDDYATQEWVNNQGFLKEHQPISANEWNDVYETVVTNSGTWGTETDWTDDINTASAYAYEQAVAQIPTPFDPTFLSGEIDKKLDAAIYEADSGKFLTAHQSLEGYLTKSSGDEYYQPKGNYVTDTQLEITSGEIVSQIPSIDGLATETFVQNVSGDITALIPTNYYPDNNPSGFITGVDLTPYQTIEGMTAYQPAGDYATTNYVNEEIGKIGSYLTATLVSGEPDVQNPSTKVIYLTKDESVTGVDQYKEWIYDTTSSWNCIGDTSISLDDYVMKTQTAVSIGLNNTATAPNSFSQGSNNTNAPQSFTQGTNNTAGENCIAQGTNNTAIMAAVAIGQCNSANFQAVSFGEYNKAGSQSIAVGACNSATSKSLAIGAVTYADNDSLALGGGVSAKMQALAQGGGNSAYYNSFAQGGGNTASYNSMAQGGGNSAYSGSIAVGGGNTAKNYSQAFGIHTLITDYGMAIGKYNKTSADVAFVIGNGYVDDTQSPYVTVRRDLFVIDKTGNVSAKSGYFYDKDGKVGGGTTYKNGYLISIDNSHKLNFTNLYCSANSAKYNVAIGDRTYAEGSASVAMGKYTSAFGDYSHSEGNLTRASGVYSHAEGTYTTANGDYAHAEGYYTSAANSGAHAEGYQTRAYGECSHTEGFMTTATQSAKYSHAEGYQTTTEGWYSHAEGDNTKAIGNYSLAVGVCTSAKGYYSFAGGGYTIANSSYQVVIGKYNDNKTNTLFEVGNGDYSIRKNALEVYDDGKVSGGDFVAGGVSLSSLTPVTLTFRTVGE